jgi:hypothetical protein
MRHPTIRCAVLAVVLTLPGVAAADSWQQFQELAAALDQLGRPADADRLRQAIDSVPPEELEEVYGGVDLTPLVEGFSQLAPDLPELQERARAVQAEFDAMRTAAVAPAPTVLLSISSATNGDLPVAPYPSVLEFCPEHDNASVSPTRRNDTQDVLDLQNNVKIARIVVEQVEIARALAKAVWDGVSRACEQVEGVIILGEGAVFNLSLACLPVDIVFALADTLVREAQFHVGLFQAKVDRKNACDAAVDTAQIAANYERLDHVHRDMEIFKQEVQEQLDRMGAKIDLLLKTQLEDALQLSSSVRAGVFYTDRLGEVCTAAQEAIDDADALGYRVRVRAQALHDLGKQLIPTNPKKAFDKCKAGYRLVTRKSASLK